MNEGPIPYPKEAIRPSPTLERLPAVRPVQPRQEKRSSPVAAITASGHLAIAERLAERSLARGSLTKQESLKLVDSLREVQKWMDQQHAGQLREGGSNHD